MRRTYLWLFLMLTVALLGIGCASDDDPTDGNSDGDTADQETPPDGDAEPEEEVETDGDGDAAETGDGETPDAETEEEEADLGLPDRLPFAFTRPDVGDPVTPQEVTDFTRKLVGFWKQVDFFKWVLRVSHGTDASTGKPDYLLWWGGVSGVKEGNVVRFVFNDPDGGGHNIMIPTPHVLASAIAAYLLTGDAAAGKAAELLCKGVTATMEGMVFDENDTINWLMARNIVTFTHQYQTMEGYEKIVDYDGWYTEYSHWNTGRFEFPNNPSWGSVWVTNMRSKDDVPHIFMAVPHIRYAAEFAPDDNVKTACADAFDHLNLFAKDIVESGYKIRSKDKNGVPYTPGYSGDEEADKAAGDLASFVMWEDYIPGAECNAMATSALIGYGSPLDNDCGPGSFNSYETYATNLHYYNFAIVRYFHLAHLANALWNRDDASALAIMEGLVDRIDTYHANPSNKVALDEWQMHQATYVMRAAAFGLPLTSLEAHMIQTYWARAVDRYAAWPNWNLWDASVPEGPVSTMPGNQATEGEEQVYWIDIEDMALIMEYCWSPFKNSAGAAFVDCDIIRDPEQW